MPLRAWKEVVVRVAKESGEDSVGLIAAGVSFYAFLALVPMLGAIVLTYGLVADPPTVVRNMNSLMAIAPADVAKLVAEQLMNVVQTSGSKKGLGLVVALAIALFGARNAAGAMISALNIAYEETEKRGFIKVNLLALLMTIAAVIGVVLGMLAIAAMHALEQSMPTSPILVALSKAASFALLALVAAAGAATLYRYAPSRDKPRWSWLTAGSILFAIVWVGITAGFGFYVAHFGNYGATYGSLGAVIILLTWIYLSTYALLFGGELNSELEHQTARDTTQGEERPVGERGAWAADHVAGG